MKKWWMESIGYQIYIKSFYDGNGDGIGDLLGISEKLDYLHDLGINLIWITPFYDSPMDDNGYDVRNFFEVASIYGTMDDFKRLLNKAHGLGIKVILDFVLNHTSDEHPWFLESRKSLDNPYRDYYIWQPPKIVDGKKQEPTNWGSFFGGSAWQYDDATDQYYMKIFSNKMPDLNWSNPEVIDAMVGVGKWWLDLGIDGFRIDAVSHLDRAPFVDSTFSKGIVLDWFKFSNLPKVHDYLHQVYQKLFSHYDTFTIGEVGGEAGIEQAITYSRFGSEELSMVFNFDHNWQNNLKDIKDYRDLKVDVLNLKKILNRWQETFKEIGWLPLNWLNHDQPRLVTHYGSVEHLDASAKMLATVMYMSRGTPFIYQGEEIGMTYYPFKHFDEFNDISTINAYKNWEKEQNATPAFMAFQLGKTSRDQARTIMQWSDAPYAGFSHTKPWFHVNPNFNSINVKQQLNNPHSILSYYKKIIHLRRFSAYHNILTYGSYDMIDKEHQTRFAYLRKLNNQVLLILNNFSDHTDTFDTINYPIDHIILHNYPDALVSNQKITLRPYESIVFEVKEHK